MFVSSEYSVEKANALGHIEQSAPITPQVSRKKKDSKSKKQKHRHRPTIDEQLEQESAEQHQVDDNNEHVDYRA